MTLSKKMVWRREIRLILTGIIISKPIPVRSKS